MIVYHASLFGLHLSLCGHVTIVLCRLVGKLQQQLVTLPCQSLQLLLRSRVSPQVGRRRRSVRIHRRLNAVRRPLR